MASSTKSKPTGLKAAWSRFKDKQAQSAQATMLEELFYDMHRNRKQIYKLNFFRGIFFGLGSVLGGTIVVALIIWLLTLLVGIPVIGDYFDGIKQSLSSPS